MAQAPGGPSVSFAVTVADVLVAKPQARALSNTALKSIRDTHEDPPGFPTVHRVDLFNEDPFLIKTLVRSHGMDYELTDHLQPWSWRSMLKGMQRPTMERIVGEGIVDIGVEAIDGSYDHKRRHAARQLGKPFADQAPVPVWDFVVTRVDGTSVRFHTSQTTNKVDIHEVGRPFETEGPAAGKGKTDGRGTYKRMIRSSYGETGAFIQPKGKGKGKGTPQDGGQADADAEIVASLAARLATTPGARGPTGPYVMGPSPGPRRKAPPPPLPPVSRQGPPLPLPPGLSIASQTFDAVD